MRRFLTLISVLAIGLTSAAFTSQAQASGKYAVTAKVSDAGFMFGESFIISGKVSPSAAGKTVVIQYLYVTDGPDPWLQYGSTATIKSDGTYAKKVTLVEPGAYHFRAYKPAGSGKAAGASASISVKAYTWHNMANADDSPFVIDPDTTGPSAGVSGLGRYGEITVANNPYTKYWESRQDASGKTSWDFGGHCKLVRATVGLDDDSASGARGHIKYYAGSKLIFDKGLIEGATHVRLDVPVSVTTQRFTIKGTRNYDTLATYLVAANPKALCAFTAVA